MTSTNDMTRMRAGAATWRSLLSAFGIAIGVLVAVPVGGYAVRLLFDPVRKRIWDSIVSDGGGDNAGLSGVVVMICLVLAAVVLTVLVVLALAAPIFVVVPLAIQSAVLWVAGSGLVWRTIGGTVLLVVIGVLTGVVLAWAVPPIREFDPMLAAVAVWVLLSGFLARLFVEWRCPELAGVRAGQLVDRRLRRLFRAWLGILLAAIVGVALFLLIG